VEGLTGEVERGAGEDVVGSERIRGKASLHQIDGNEKGIAEEDLAIART
jgi:hypothetical protein